MLGFNRNERIGEDKDAGKNVLKPALYSPPSATPSTPATAGGRSWANPSAPAANALATSRDGTLSAPAPAAEPRAQAAIAAEAAQSRLFVGVNIRLKGVEISNCDALVIEGQVEATVHSKVMEIAKPGTLKGTATIDVAEIHGEFSGEITARTRLVVHGTGRVSGTIRYGKLIVEEGGEVRGDVNQLDEATPSARSGGEVQDPRRAYGATGNQLGTH